MHLIIFQLQRQSPLIFGWFSSVKNSSPIHIFSIGRPYTNTCINASHVSSINWLQRSPFTQFCLENPRLYIDVFAKPKLQLVPSRSYRAEIIGVIICIWECLLECHYWSPTMFLFANCSHCILWHAISGESFTVTSANFAEHIFVKPPPPLKRNKIFFTTKMAFDKYWRLQYWTLPRLGTGDNQPIHWFLGDKSLGIQQGTSNGFVRPNPGLVTPNNHNIIIHLTIVIARLACPHTALGQWARSLGAGAETTRERGWGVRAG